MCRFQLCSKCSAGLSHTCEQGIRAREGRVCREDEGDQKGHTGKVMQSERERLENVEMIERLHLE